MTLDVIRFADLPVTPWHNGAGRKADIASTADWSVGFAWLDADAPFSDLTSRDRTITLVEGPGFTLDFAGQPSLCVDAPFQPARFDGGWPARCRLSGGPGLVLNAMTTRARFHHSVTVAQVASMEEVTPGPAAAVFIVLLTGTAMVDGAAGTLQPKDAVRVDRPTTLRADPGSLAYAVSIGALP